MAKKQTTLKGLGPRYGIKIRKQLTTSIVYQEIQHIKAKQGALDMLQQTNRLQVRDPAEKTINIVNDASGCMPYLSNHHHFS